MNINPNKGRANVPVNGSNCPCLDTQAGFAKVGDLVEWEVTLANLGRKQIES